MRIRQASELSNDAALDLPLDVLILDESWSTGEVDRLLDQAQTMLNTCAIRFADIRIKRVNAPDYLRDLATGASRTLMDAVRPGGNDRRVTIVFARDTRMGMPYDAEAFGKGNTRTRAWLTDSVWLTLALQDRDIALAHELFHVLSNSGEHVQIDGNLMLNRTTGNNRTLNAAQCELAHRISLESGLTYRTEH
jgi:hypothetical protein